MRIQLNNLNNKEQITLTKEYVEEIMNKYFFELVKLLTSEKGTSTKAIQEQEIVRLNLINKSNELFNDEINKKIQEAEMRKQIIEEQINSENSADVEIVEYVVNTYKMFNPDKDEQDIIKCAKQIIQSYRKKEFDVNKEDILAATIEKLNKPKKHQRKNNNPQQVNRIIP